MGNEVDTAAKLQLCEPVSQGVTRRCRLYLNWPIAPLVYEPKCGGGKGGCGVSADENSCAHHVTWCPNKLWISKSIFNPCCQCCNLPQPTNLGLLEAVWPTGRKFGHITLKGADFFSQRPNFMAGLSWKELVTPAEGQINAGNFSYRPILKDSRHMLWYLDVN